MEKQLQADMVAAMKAKETVRLASLRAIKAAIMLAKTAEGATGEIDDAAIVKIIQKLVKQRKESAQQYNEAGRPELAENELAEAACMEVYLPKQRSEAEVEARLQEIIAEGRLISTRSRNCLQACVSCFPEFKTHNITIYTISFLFWGMCTRK